jgi:hypothetical protein
MLVVDLNFSLFPQAAVVRRKNKQQRQYSQAELNRVVRINASHRGDVKKRGLSSDMREDNPLVKSREKTTWQDLPGNRHRH